MLKVLRNKTDHVGTISNGLRNKIDRVGTILKGLRNKIDYVRTMLKVTFNILRKNIERLWGPLILKAIKA